VDVDVGTVVGIDLPVSVGVAMPVGVGIASGTAHLVRNSNTVADPSIPRFSLCRFIIFHSAERANGIEMSRPGSQG
jgi:hypothetical protein